MTWTKENSRTVYGLNRHDLHFLDIGETGELVVRLKGIDIPISAIMSQLRSILELPPNVDLPSFTLRLPELIDYQISKIYNSFKVAFDKYDYSGTFKPLYPIKVSQLKRKINTVMNAHKDYGLEAGTKSELVLLLKVFREQKDRIIMCNGVKDREYMLIVKNAIKNGYRIYLSIESITEFYHVTKILPSKYLNLMLRIKPYVNLPGYWGASSGRNSKFGLSIADLERIMDLINEHNFSSSLIGIHAHPGSQMESISDLEGYFEYLFNIFQQLHEAGLTNIRLIDVGGGLPIDYDNSLDEHTFEKYASTMVKVFTEKAKAAGLSHPNIMIEAGRAVVALSSMMVIQPLEYHNIFPLVTPEERHHIQEKHNLKEVKSTVESILSMWKDWIKLPRDLKINEIREYEKETYVVKEFLRDMFFQLNNYPQHMDIPEIQKLVQVDSFLLGNFSVFNGACDHVMIDQYFPILPIKDLHVQPEGLVRLVDITCDSDGEISVYRTKSNPAPLFARSGYPLTSNTPIEWKGFPVGDIDNILDTFIAIPLVGAYQDIIEFDHNLIGDLADVELQTEGDTWKISIIEHAEKIQDIVKQVGYVIDNKEDPYISLKGD